MGASTLKSVLREAGPSFLGPLMVVLEIGRVKPGPLFGRKQKKSLVTSGRLPLIFRNDH